MTPTPPPSLTSPSHRNRDARRLAVAIGVAALLWFYMFSPWTSGLTNFWLTMACAAILLTSLALLSSRPSVLQIFHFSGNIWKCLFPSLCSNVTS